MHCMRDHPQHGVPFLGAGWGARLDLPGVRDKWLGAWGAMLGDPLCWAGRDRKGPDQDLLTRHVWPWTKDSALQHDSYTCDRFARSHLPQSPLAPTSAPALLLLLLL